MDSYIVKIEEEKSKYKNIEKLASALTWLAMMQNRTNIFFDGISKQNTDLFFQTVKTKQINELIIKKVKEKDCKNDVLLVYNVDDLDNPPIVISMADNNLNERLRKILGFELLVETDKTSINKKLTNKNVIAKIIMALTVAASSILGFAYNIFEPLSLSALAALVFLLGDVNYNSASGTRTVIINRDKMLSHLTLPLTSITKFFCVVCLIFSILLCIDTFYGIFTNVPYFLQEIKPTSNSIF